MSILSYEYYPEIKQSDSYQSVFFNEKEFKILSLIIEEYKSHSSNQKNPKAKIVVGPMASGKTTIIKDKFISNYVYIDHDDVLIKVSEKFENYEKEKLVNFAMFCLNQILEQSISAKLNIVMESLGNNKERLDTIVNSLIECRYKSELIIIHCDIDEGLKRHLERTQDGKFYPTSYYSEEITFESILTYLKSEKK